MEPRPADILCSDFVGAVEAGEVFVAGVSGAVLAKPTVAGSLGASTARPARHPGDWGRMASASPGRRHEYTTYEDVHVDVQL